MAGSGKSTFAAKLAQEIDVRAKAKARAGAQRTETDGSSSSSSGGGGAYFVNLDPAVSALSYPPNVDIRDTVDYAQVMKQYNLGPNGGILTALNLFTTKFDQVLGILEKRAVGGGIGEQQAVDAILLDTPGQIEIFTWSASGTLITSALQTSRIPTVVAYVIDTPRTTSPATFMSNMLYACSIMYKTRLPFVLVFNKIDQHDWAFARDWMQDFEAFQKALKVAGKPTRSGVVRSGQQQQQHGAGYSDDGDGNFMNSLMNSMALVLDEFYSSLNAVGVSATTGEGIDAFLDDALPRARAEFVHEVRPSLEAAARARHDTRERDKQRSLQRLLSDMQLDRSTTTTTPRRRRGVGSKQGQAEASDADDDDGEPQEEWHEEYDGDGQIVDPDTDEERPDYDDLLAGASGAAGRTYGADGTAWPKPA
ncbi:hypothetical protein K437DRAFT_236842 [Tilletiaria anomala UBC 951]|uniref:GPN-loop GTPase n=1 Tax=Tilletiaria anomala (strain ATCC 24038 / CBS 436.72 / UBC 951) TaxID=1037660 RepID=A0A066VR73_TILAU|nr:uncharacterized protein K437DRAFT_236842 [Tilletiaria anomala UBC 951]KDN43951.1 hypothetical protein K437DRAFT_236842 [Tilletiaria anomala UBC 951]